MAGFRIVVGGDDAGYDYKATLIKDLEADPRVSEVIDVGPKSSSDKTAYPLFAIAAAEMVAQGKADRACKRPWYSTQTIQLSLTDDFIS